MTPELATARIGLQTASNAATIMGGLQTDGLEKLCRRLAWERTFNVSLESGSYQSQAMIRGAELEADLLDWYEFQTEHVLLRSTPLPDGNGGVVDTPGVFLVHRELPTVAATLDAIALGSHTVQGKCPEFNAFMEVLDRFNAPRPWKVNPVPSEYRHQCRWEMWVAGLDRCDFVVWHPDPGGIIVPFELTDAERLEMHRRALLVENRIEEWQEKLTKQVQRRIA
jgi:hypothetical protein